MQTVTRTDSIDELMDLVRAGIELWMQAGEMLARLRAKNPHVYGDVMRKHPAVTMDMLMTLEAVAAKRIYPHLLMSQNHGHRRLLEMPYADQVRYYAEPVEVLVRTENGKPVVSKKNTAELSPREIAQVFGPEGIRSVKDQLPLCKNSKNTNSKGEEESTVIERVETFRIELHDDGEFSAKPIHAAMSQTVLLKREGEKLIADVTFVKSRDEV